MLIPLNDTIPDIAIISKGVETNDLGESPLLFAITIGRLLNIIKSKSSYSLLSSSLALLSSTKINVY